LCIPAWVFWHGETGLCCFHGRRYCSFPGASIERRELSTGLDLSVASEWRLFCLCLQPHRRLRQNISQPKRRRVIVEPGADASASEVSAPQTNAGRRGQPKAW
ncbi:MAG: hypothetical protein ACOYMG_21660, partial [Candidatus Methylumidiphilus sp.]